MGNFLKVNNNWVSFTVDGFSCSSFLAAIIAWTYQILFSMCPCTFVFLRKKKKTLLIVVWSNNTNDSISAGASTVDLLVLQTWAFLVTVTVTHENTTKQMFRWATPLHQTPLSPSSLLLPPSPHVCLCLSLLLHQGCKQKPITIFMRPPHDKWKHEREKEQNPLFIVLHHISIILSPAITFSIPSVLFLLSVLTALIPSFFLSIMSVYIVAPSKIRLVCVCVSLWITTLIERLNSLFYMM